MLCQKAERCLLCCVRAQIVEDDMASEGGKSVRRTTTSDKVAEALGPRGAGGSGGEGAKSGGGASPAAARTLLPALKEVVAGLASQYELMKEVVAAVQARSLPAPTAPHCCDAEYPLSACPAR
jgi:hypothetical protein